MNSEYGSRPAFDAPVDPVLYRIISFDSLRQHFGYVPSDVNSGLVEDSCNLCSPVSNAVLAAMSSNWLEYRLTSAHRSAYDSGFTHSVSFKLSAWDI